MHRIGVGDGVPKRRLALFVRTRTRGARAACRGAAALVQPGPGERRHKEPDEEEAYGLGELVPRVAVKGLELYHPWVE